MSDTDIPEDSFSDCENIELDDKFVPTKSLGQQIYNATGIASAPIKGAGKYVMADGTSYYIAACNGKLYYSIAGSGTWSAYQIGGADLTIDSAADVEMVQYLNSMWIVNGTYPIITNSGQETSRMIKIDGTTPSAVVATEVDGVLYGPPEGASFIIVHMERLFVARSIDQHNGLYWTEPYLPYGGAYQDWVPEYGLNYDFVGKDDAESITGIRSYQGYVFVGKPQNIYRYATQGDITEWQSMRVDTRHGWLYNRTIQEFNGQLIYMTGEGVAVLDGNNVTLVSEQIKDQMLALPQMKTNIRQWLTSTTAEFATGTVPDTTDTADNELKEKVVVCGAGFTDTTTADFEAGESNIGLSTTGDNLKSIVKIVDKFTDGEYISNPAWTVSDGTWSAATNKLVPTGALITHTISTPSTYAIGSWKIKFRNDASTHGAILEFRFMYTSPSNAYGISCRKMIDGTREYILFKSTGAGNVTNGSYNSIEDGAEKDVIVTRNNDGDFEVFIEGTSRITANDVTYNTSAIMSLDTNGGTAIFGGDLYFDSVIYLESPTETIVETAQTFISQEHDTSCSENGYAWEAFTINNTIPTNASIVYKIGTYDTTGTLWSAIPGAQTQVISNGGTPTIARKRYIKWQAVVTLGDGDFSTFEITDVSINISSTGTLDLKYVQNAIAHLLSNKTGTVAIYTKTSDTDLSEASWIDTPDWTEVVGNVFASTPKHYLRIKWSKAEGATITGITVSSEYVSEKKDLGVTPAGWGKYDSAYTLNGQTITHWFRSAATAEALDSATWYAQTPGSIITGAALNPHIQFMLRFDTNTYTQQPSVESVNISYYVGSNLGQPCSAVWKNNYWLNVADPGSSINNLVYKYNTGGYWLKRTNKNNNVYFASAGDLLSGTSESDGYLRYNDLGTKDDNSEIVSYFVTKNFELVSMIKLFRAMYVTSKSNAAWTLSYSVDGGTYIDVTMALQSLVKTVRKVFTDIVRGRFIKFKITSSVEDAAFAFGGLQVEWKPIRQLDTDGA